MNTNTIQNEIKKIKKEIEMNDLSLPTAFEAEIAEVTLAYIKRFKIAMTFTSQSSYSQELEKAYKELNRHFTNDSLECKDRFINSTILTNDISKNAFKILNEIKVNSNSYEDYQSAFHIQKGKVSLYALNIPYQLDTLSYVNLGHEIIHLLKETNLKEYQNNLRHSEVLPMLYEFIQMKYKRKDIRKNIISRRMLSLSDMNQSVEKVKEFIGNTTDFAIYKLLDYQYFISFYYTILLYELYLRYPKTILREFKNVLLQNKTTQEVLEYFEMYEKLKIFEFDKGYERLLKIVS